MNQNQVVVYDTKHGTNRFGLKLGCFVGLDNNGLSRIIAASLLLNETEESFCYVFEWFSTVFGEPKIIFTDSDKQMARAIQNSFPSSTHLLCTFHLYKNFFKKVRPVFLGKKNDWNEFSNMWWKLCKLSDLEGLNCFDNNWSKFMNFYDTFSNKSNKKVNKIYLIYN